MMTTTMAHPPQQLARWHRSPAAFLQLLEPDQQQLDLEAAAAVAAAPEQLQPPSVEAAPPLLPDCSG
jgi:hypothetical protein